MYNTYYSTLQYKTFSLKAFEFHLRKIHRTIPVLVSIFRYRHSRYKISTSLFRRDLFFVVSVVLMLFLGITVNRFFYIVLICGMYLPYFQCNISNFTVIRKQGFGPIRTLADRTVSLG